MLVLNLVPSTGVARLQYGRAQRRAAGQTCAAPASHRDDRGGSRYVERQSLGWWKEMYLGARLGREDDPHRRELGRYLRSGQS